jgi:transposase
LIAKEKTARLGRYFSLQSGSGVDLAHARYEKFMETTPSGRLHDCRTAAMGATSRHNISA